MKVVFDIKKSLWENVQGLHERLKKLKKKRARLLKLIEEEKKRESSQRETEENKTVEVRKKRKREWYERFRWMFTSGGFLVIGGRDVKTNEIIVKKYLEDGDLYFHADIVGAPSVVMKKGERSSEKDRWEAAIFSASYSRAWKIGLMKVPVFYVRSKQVSLSPPAGEYRPRGGVIISGKREWLEVPLFLYICFDGDKNMFYVSVEKRENCVKLIPGRKEKEKIARALLKMFGLGREFINELVPLLPPGPSDIESP